MSSIPVNSVSALKKKRQLSFVMIAVLLLLPMAVINLVAFVVPVASLAQISFLQSRSGGILTDEYTFSNYIGFFTDSFNWGLMYNSLWLSAMVRACSHQDL